ncbi:outer membrane beta-barrel protein [Helicobacter baculiformis]|uniref:Outer membrane beta-barrel protein n=1 Tax=Helicobacter baculiformis TaxID=427351 RepID=A0ABV7ZGF4_9HELI|nr:outer membrane beta-barrel protein [Helicobacter baculiformis]
MKRWALGFLCIAGIADATTEQTRSKSKIFVGVMTGFQSARFAPAPWQNNFLWGICGGYQFNAHKYISVRTDIGYIMALRPTALHTNVYSFLSVNVDMINDFYRLSKKMIVGTYLGLGLGYFQSAQTLDSSVSARSFMGYNGVLNLGVGGTIEKQHRVELGIKLPFGQIHSTKNPALSLWAFYWVASYAYLF